MKTGLSLQDYLLQGKIYESLLGFPDFYIVTPKETSTKEPPLRKRVPSQPQYKRRW